MKFLTTAALAALSTIAFAQGKYETSGAGCGNAGKAVLRINDKTASATNYSGTTGPNEYAYPVNVSATTKTILSGVRFFTQSVSGTKTVEASVHLPDSTTPTEPSGTALTTTLMTVGSTAQYYDAHFDSTQVITGPFWVTFKNYDTYTATTQGPTVVKTSNLSTGTTITTIYWRRPSFSSHKWTSTVTVKIPAYDLLLGGTSPLRLTAAAAPTLGKTFQLDLSQGKPGAAIAIFGASKTTWGTIPLPLDLRAVAPGCWLFSSMDLMFATGVNGSGKAQISLPIPNDKSLSGSTFENQWLNLAVGSNALGLLFSNLGSGTIG
jgi:hypothetical protein